MNASPLLLGSIHHVLRGRAVPFARINGADGGLSAIAKQPISMPVAVGLLGLEGDEQGNPRSHGGPEKAVHHYAQEHYAPWRAELGSLPALSAPGAFGENLASIGVTEADICWGDEIGIGTVRLQVSQSRQPCWKLNARFGVPGMTAQVQNTARTGWYYRVLEPGTLQAGDRMWLLARPHPQWPLTRVINLLYRHMLDRPALQEFAQLRLPESWQTLVHHRLEQGKVEDWTRRIDG